MRGRPLSREHHRGQWLLDCWRRAVSKIGSHAQSERRFLPDLNSLLIKIGPVLGGGIYP
jgi:hypothetical protein